MKRFAFITPAFTDSTVPLIQQFLKGKNEVDLFFLSKKEMPTYSAFNTRTQVNSNLINIIPRHLYSELDGYFGEHFNAYAIKLNRPYKNIPFIGTIFIAYRSLLLKKFSSIINSRKYDGVYIISLYDSIDTYDLCKYINGNVIVGLHEVCNHSNPDFEHAPKLISFLSQKKIPIVVFSSKSKNDIIKYQEVNPFYVHETRFGKYNSYPTFIGKSNMPIPQNYFLFMGNIKPYKGIDIFVASALKMIKENSKCNFVIAGKGYHEILDVINDNKRFTIINRFISNEELVDLIAGCIAVVCPYKSASQSGIIQSAYAFNKPVIVSELDSFRECVLDKKTGEFCRVNDVDSLKEAMSHFMDNDAYLMSLRSNIEHIDEHLVNYSWEKIYNDYKFFWQ